MPKNVNKINYLVLITIISICISLFSLKQSFAVNYANSSRCFDGCSTKCFAGTSKYYNCKSDCKRRCYKDFG